jgi:hypothetical protein
MRIRRPASSHGTASVVIRVWTLCIIRSVRNSVKRTSLFLLAVVPNQFDAAKPVAVGSRLSGRPSRRMLPSIVESVAQLDIDFARVIPMKSSEGLTVVQFDATVGHVQGVQGGGDTLPEVFAK